ncbi:MAG: outer membrane lipoprotein carrier protein LolA [Gammaproteobacteria bacterium]|nr:outer membrane lipoprotein carrier protein LolA [Gammaproteobacteria bacterium]
MVSLRSHLAGYGYEMTYVFPLFLLLLILILIVLLPSWRSEGRAGLGLGLRAGMRLLGPGVVALALGCFALATCPSRAADTNAIVNAWLASQTNLTTWQAELTQTRALSTLTQPLTARGRVWFAAPDRFRWELGEPPQTIAVRQPAEVVILYPRLKRAERYPLDAATTDPWKDAMTLLDAGFPRSRAELDAAFRIAALTETNGLHTLALQPRSVAARKLMPEIQLTFSPRDNVLRATQLRFTDGSLLRNDFTNVMTNPKLADSLFTPDIGADFQISEPAKGMKR